MARDAAIFGNIVGFGVIGILDLWGSFAGGRPPHKVFAVVHLLFAAAFIRVGRRSVSSRQARPNPVSRGTLRLQSCLSK